MKRTETQIRDYAGAINIEVWRDDDGTLNSVNLRSHSYGAPGVGADADLEIDGPDVQSLYDGINRQLAKDAPDESKITLNGDQDFNLRKLFYDNAGHTDVFQLFTAIVHPAQQTYVTLKFQLTRPELTTLRNTLRDALNPETTTSGQDAA